MGIKGTRFRYRQFAGEVFVDQVVLYGALSGASQSWTRNDGKW